MAIKYKSEQEQMDAIFAKIVKENQQREAKAKPKKGEELVKEAAFLKRWAKGKPIVRQTSDATFWRAGKWMTQLQWPTVDALVAAGLAKIEGNSKEGGARLQML